MLATILFILKIIGIVLLAILSLILFIILLVLFVPVRYKGYGVKERDEGSLLRAGAGASWLFKILKADYEYGEKARGLTIRVLGIRLRSREEKEEKKKLRAERRELKKRTKETSNRESGKGQGNGKTKAEYTITEYDDTKDVFRESIIDPKGIPVEDHSDKESAVEDIISHGRDENTGDKDVKQDLLERIKGLYDKVSGVLKGLRAKAEEAEYYIDALSNDASNRQAVELILKKGRSLLKSIRPRQIMGSVDYGAGDPADTGRVLAAAAIAYPLYGPGLKLNPDFEESVLKFDVTLKGRVYIFVLVKTIAALYFNKKVKRLIRIMKKENGNGR